MFQRGSFEKLRAACTGGTILEGGRDLIERFIHAERHYSERNRSFRPRCSKLRDFNNSALLKTETDAASQSNDLPEGATVSSSYVQPLIAINSEIPKRDLAT